MFHLQKFQNLTSKRRCKAIFCITLKQVERALKNRRLFLFRLKRFFQMWNVLFDDLKIKKATQLLFCRPFHLILVSCEILKRANLTRAGKVIN